MNSMKKVLYFLAGLFLLWFMLIIKFKYFGVFPHGMDWRVDPISLMWQKYGYNTNPYQICWNEFIWRKVINQQKPISISLQDEIADEITNNWIWMCSKNPLNYGTSWQYTIYELHINNVINWVDLVGAIYYSWWIIIQTGNIDGVKNYRTSDQSNLIQLWKLNTDINQYFNLN